MSEADGGPGARFIENMQRRLGGTQITLDPEAGFGQLPQQATAILGPLERSLANLRRALREQQVAADAAAHPDVPGTSETTTPPTLPARWIPIGPTVVTRGQAEARPPVSGRVVGIALAPAVQRVYIAASNGGVWRSDDDGRTWRSMMQPWDWDRNPLTHQCDTLSCGAVAVDPTNPDRVWVGTGDGQGRDFGGIGPVFSADGGLSWREESSDQNLDGEFFYKLAVDPNAPETVVGATTNGLFTRSLDGSGHGRWTRHETGVFTGVVVSQQGNATTFYAAKRSTGVYRSTNATSWSSFGTDFPAASAHRIELAVRPDDPKVVHALISNSSGATTEVWRIDTDVDGKWRQVVGSPTALPDLTEGDQGTYDLAIAVDPRDANTVFIAGDYFTTPANDYVANIQRLRIAPPTPAQATVPCSHTNIGFTVHPDVHVLVVDPSDRNRLWVGCDGGLYRSLDARENVPRFSSMNTGLAITLLTAMDQHPDRDAVLYSGTQDNGCIRSLGSEVWTHVRSGDCGSVLVHEHQPSRVAINYLRDRMRWAIDGGNDYGSWTRVNIGMPALFYPPSARAPRGTAVGNADRIAVGGDQIGISEDFGISWTKHGTAIGDRYCALVFATHERLYAADRGGLVRKYERQADGSWRETRIDATVNTATTPHTSPLPDERVEDMAVAPAAGSEPELLYVCFSGVASTAAGNRVWRFDGAGWTPRSTGLPDVQHHALVVDPAHRDRIYAGTDIGIYRSLDGGGTWTAWSTGLPDSSVQDLRIHGPTRMIRAATFGRSMYERHLDHTESPRVELWVRDTILDTGRNPTAAAARDPRVPASDTTTTLDPTLSPDIKVDVPSAAGIFQTRTTDIDILEFEESIHDRSDRVGTVAASVGPLKNRVYVQVRSRGVRPADDVRVVLLVAEATGGTPPALPAGYDAHVRAGTAISGGGWSTVGTRPLIGVRAGHGRVAGFELPSSLLPEPSALSGHAQWCLLALLHHADDPFDATEVDPRVLSRTVRKAALKRITVRSFTGTMPQVPAARAWYRIQPLLSNLPVGGAAPEFRIYGEENGRAVVELAWDQQALMAPSGDYEGNDALRYYSSNAPLQKTITKADGTTMDVHVPTQAITLVGNRTTWTIPDALWRGYQAEAAKGAAGSFTFNLYYRVRVQPTGSPDAVVWPADTVITNNPDAPHLGLLGTNPNPSAPFPDADGLAAMSDLLWRWLVELSWSWLPQSDPDRQCLVRILAHETYTAMNPPQRAKVLELWVVAGPSSRQRLDQLLGRRVWHSRTESRPAATSRAFRGGQNLIENLLALRWITPNPDLVGVASNEQLVDDVISEIIDPNGQINRGEAKASMSTIQALLIHVSPAEYARLMCGLLSDRACTQLVRGDEVTLPPRLFQYARYGGAQANDFLVRTNSELSFHGAILKYGQGDRFPQYDPSAGDDDPQGINTVFRTVVGRGLYKTEITRVLSGVFPVTFQHSASGPSATVRDEFLAALDARIQPLVAITSFGAVLAMRREGGRVFYKNASYAGSNPPAGHVAGAQLSNPDRRVEDPSQALESISETDLDTQLQWFHAPQNDLVS